MNKTQSYIVSARLALAKALWPKQVSEGSLFTIERHLFASGKPSGDGSWVGATLRADIVDGDRILFSVLNEYHTPARFDSVKGFWLVPGVNCEVKALTAPLSKQEGRTLYDRVKGAA